jgi:hypothetical protein
MVDSDRGASRSGGREVAVADGKGRRAWHKCGESITRRHEVSSLSSERLRLRFGTQKRRGGIAVRCVTGNRKRWPKVQAWQECEGVYWAVLEVMDWVESRDVTVLRSLGRSCREREKKDGRKTAVFAGREDERRSELDISLW